MRSAGILLPITALPSPWGIGTMGQSARNFIHFLQRSGQAYWQILPIGPTSFGDSPYQSFSSYAGNPYLIDLDDLCEQSLLKPSEYQSINWGFNSESIDYDLLYKKRIPVLKKAVDRILAHDAEAFLDFCTTESFWLRDYALFMALKHQYHGVAWYQWPQAMRHYQSDAVSEAETSLVKEIQFWQGVQYLFFTQWHALKSQANACGISIIGDLPIYVAYDSVDVWANPEQFQLAPDLTPIEVAGCPPDGFSSTGQLWGNPLFNWSKMETDGYKWWLHRISFQLQIFDVLRIDHFRGFDSYYAVPFGAADARNGRWCDGPGIAFFNTLHQHIKNPNIIAEDLGFLTPSVHALLTATGYPGMKVLEFAFDTRDTGSGYLPHCYPRHCVVYTGTHDNDTILGWMQTAPKSDVARAIEYLRLSPQEGYHWGMMRSAWASVADLAIMQMQDLLGLGSEARTNIPSTVGGNWVWRCKPGVFSQKLADQLHHEMELYGRLPADRSILLQ